MDKQSYRQAKEKRLNDGRIVTFSSATAEDGKTMGSAASKNIESQKDIPFRNVKAKRGTGAAMSELQNIGSRSGTGAATAEV